MKKNVEAKKLQLNLEKVRELTPAQAEEAAGGASCVYSASYSARTSAGSTIVPGGDYTNALLLNRF